MKRRTLLFSAAPLAALGLAACSSTSDSTSGSGSSGGGASDGGDGGITVVASTNVWGDLASSIGGDAVEVTSIITDPDTDPHEYEASSRNQLALSKAAVVIENGGGFDDFMDRMLKAAKNKDATVVNAVDVSGYTAEDGEELNEHVWYDFPTVLKVIDKVAEALGEAAPDQKDTFSSNAESLKGDVQKLIDKEKDLKSEIGGKGVAITEPVPLYLLEAVGLENKTPEDFSEAVEEGDDVAPADLKATLALFSEGEVDLLAYNVQATNAQTEQVKKEAEKNDIPVVEVNETLPDGKDFTSWMDGILGDIESALVK